jgi:hypothetical protein
MKTKTTTKFSFGWLIIGLNLLCLAALVVLVWYGQSQMLALQNAYQKLDRAALEETKREEWADLLQETVATREIIHRAIITDADLSKLIEKLEQLAAGVGAELEITNATLDNDAQPQIELAFKASGRYEAVWRLADLIDNLPYQAEIARADFNREGLDEKKTTTNWQARFELVLPKLSTAKNEKV